MAEINGARDLLITALEKFILPARENIAQIEFQSKLKFIVPYRDDKKHGPSEFDYPRETNDPNIYP